MTAAPPHFAAPGRPSPSLGIVLAPIAAPASASGDASVRATPAASVPGRFIRLRLPRYFIYHGWLGGTGDDPRTPATRSHPQVRVIGLFHFVARRADA